MAGNVCSRKLPAGYAITCEPQWRPPEPAVARQNSGMLLNELLGSVDCLSAALDCLLDDARCDSLNTLSY